MGMQNAHLAIASVPIQSWGCLYDQDAALKNGTVFQDLDLPFLLRSRFPDRYPPLIRPWIRKNRSAMKKYWRSKKSVS